MPCALQESGVQCRPPRVCRGSWRGTATGWACAVLAVCGCCGDPDGALFLKQAERASGAEIRTLFELLSSRGGSQGGAFGKQQLAALAAETGVDFSEADLLAMMQEADVSGQDQVTYLDFDRLMRKTVYHKC